MKQFIPLILFTVFSNFLSQIMLKHGMTSIEKFEISLSGFKSSFWDVCTNPWVIGGLFAMVISMGSHLAVLSRVEISFAYPFLGLSFALITVYGYFFLGESVGVIRISGVFLIIAGVSLVASSN